MPSANPSKSAKPSQKQRLLSLELENAALRDELSVLRIESSLLREVGGACASESDYFKVLQIVAERARDLLAAKTALVPVVDFASSTYSCLAASGEFAEDFLAEPLPLDIGVCGWVWKNRKPWWSGAFAALPEEERSGFERESRDVILVPIVGKKSFLGGIACHNKTNGEPFSEHDLRLLEILACQASAAIENSLALIEAKAARSEAEALHSKTLLLNRQLASANTQLERLSLYDPLTGLPNRSLLSDRLSQEIFQSRASGKSGALFLIDLDDFSDINDSLGHDAGDQILLSVSQRLIEALPLGCTIARLGGDEFAALYPNLSAAKAMAVASDLLSRFSETVRLDGLPATLARASIGVSLFPEDSATPAALLRYAEAAMYAAKRDKLGAVRYDPSHESRSQGRVALAAELREAMGSDQFVLHYQPKASLPGSAIVGCEALARWNHPTKGFVQPDLFISSLEHSGLIHDFTVWALGQAVWTRSQWLKIGWDLRVSVNIPVSTLVEPRFQAALDAMAASGSNLDGIIFEITETLFLSDFSRMSQTLSRCRELGVDFSIDDFGTGHSSLSRLRDFPVSELKIDKSFVMGMMDNKDDLAIVRSTIDLARNLGVQSVAEGVETEASLLRLSELGCDFAQGYHIGRPMPAPDFLAFLEKTRT